jgi:hypothetical protein
LVVRDISGEIVDRDVVLLKPPEHSDVGQSERAAAFQRNPDRQPLRSRWCAWATTISEDTLTVKRTSTILNQRK